MNTAISAILKAPMIAIFTLLLLSLVNAQNAPPPKPTGPAISAEFSFKSHYVQVKGSKMHYVDEGEGDLIGMGKSDKPDLDYRFVTHAEYFEAFINELKLTNITLVIHDWGSALGMDFARRNPDRVKGIVFMEAIVPPAMPIPSYEAMGGSGEFFRNVRTPGVGEEMILQNNMFVEVLLPELGTVRNLTDAEWQAYRAPYPTPDSRKPTLVWPREVPIAGEPADVLAVIERNGAWLHETSIPKLMFYAEPGAFGGPEVATYFAENLKNIETNYVGPGYHYIQEDHPHMIGRELADWLRRHK